MPVTGNMHAYALYVGILLFFKYRQNTYYKSNTKKRMTNVIFGSST